MNLDTENLYEFLQMLKVAVSKNANETKIEESEEGYSLLCTVNSPFGTGGETGYRISMIPDDGTVMTEISLYLFTEVDSGMFAGLDRLMNEINSRISIGSWRLYDDTGTVTFAHGMLLGETVDEQTALLMTGKTLAVMEDITLSTGRYIIEYRTGGELENIIKAVGRTGE